MSKRLSYRVVQPYLEMKGLVDEKPCRCDEFEDAIKLQIMLCTSYRCYGHSGYKPFNCPHCRSNEARLQELRKIIPYEEKK